MPSLMTAIAGMFMTIAREKMCRKAGRLKVLKILLCGCTEMKLRIVRADEGTHKESVICGKLSFRGQIVRLKFLFNSNQAKD